MDLRTVWFDRRPAERAVACVECSARIKSFCSAVPNRDLAILARSRNRIQFNRRETIIREGDPAVSFFNVASGVVKLYRSLSDGRNQIIGFRFPGEFFAILETKRHASTVEAVTSVEVCRFPKARLKRLLNSFPQLQVQFLQMVNRQLAASEDQIFLLGRKTAREKVATFLLRYGRDLEQTGAKAGRHVNLPMTRTEIADFLGLTTETVSRVFTSLARENVIAVGASRSVNLIDIDSLARISGN